MALPVCLCPNAVKPSSACCPERSVTISPLATTTLTLSLSGLAAFTSPYDRAENPADCQPAVFLAALLEPKYPAVVPANIEDMNSRGFQPRNTPTGDRDHPDAPKSKVTVGHSGHGGGGGGGGGGGFGGSPGVITLTSTRALISPTWSLLTYAVLSGMSVREISAKF